MLLPFSTNVWNALRFILLSLVVVPVIEKALHRLHQMKTAHRLLSSKPVRIRQSKIGNWGLHQEVDELNYSSKALAVAVAVLYVGLSLYTEYASGSQQVTRTRIWQAPASKHISQHGKTKFYDTNLVAAGSYTGCMSQASRMAIQKLSEDIVEHKSQIFDYVPFNRSWPTEGSLVGSAYDEKYQVQVRDIGTFLHLSVNDKKNPNLTVPFEAAIDDEKVCIWNDRVLCFSKSEKITVLAVIGNLMHFQDVFYLFYGNTVPLLSNDVFTVEGDAEDNEAWARVHTRTEFMKSRNSSASLSFRTIFKHAGSGAGTICNKIPQIEPEILRIPQNASLIPYERRQRMSIHINRTAKCIGLFRKNLLLFYEFENSTMVCYERYRIRFCAKKVSDGSFYLSKSHNKPDLDIDDVEWTLKFRDQGLGLGDVARGAMVSFMMSMEMDRKLIWDMKVHGMDQAPKGADNIVEHLKKGIPKLTQVGGPNSTYVVLIGKDERATVVTWVFLLWVVIFSLALSYLCCTNMAKFRLLPDVDFLYRRAVMEKYTRHNSVKSIRNPPTVSMSKTGKFGELSISYDAAVVGKMAPGDLLV